MLEEKDIKLLENQLPPDYKNKIAEITGLSRTTVWKFFRSDEMKPSTFEKVYDAALELMRIHGEKKASRTQIIKKLRNDSAQQNLLL